MDGHKITFGTAIGYVKGWPTSKVTVFVDGVALTSKTGDFRKFATREAAHKAAVAAIKSSVTA